MWKFSVFLFFHFSSENKKKRVYVTLFSKAVFVCFNFSDENIRSVGYYVAITYRVHDFENFDENFVQGTISPLLKSHIPPDGSVSLFKYLSTELKRI